MHKPRINNTEIFFLVAYITSRIIIYLIPGNFWDHNSFLEPITEILQGKNPYLALDNSEIVYPPLFYIIFAIFIGAFGPYDYAFGICSLAFDVGTLIIMYKILQIFYQKSEDIWQRLFFYAFFPARIVVCTMKLPQGIAVFFVAIAIYFFLKKKWFIFGIFVAIGTLVEIYPLFLLYVVGIILLAKKQYKDLIASIIGFTATFLLIMLLYFGFDIRAIFNLFLAEIGRNSTTSFEGMFNPNITFEILPNVSVDPFSIIIIIEMIAFGILLFRYVKKRNTVITQTAEMQLLFLFFCLLPLFFLNIFFRYFFWSLPIFIPLIQLNFTRPDIKRFLIYNNILLVILLVIIYIIMPSGLSSNLSDLTVIFGPLVYDFLILYLFLSSIWFVAMMIIWLKYWGKSILGNEPFNKNIIRFSLLRVIVVFVMLFHIAYLSYFMAVILGGIFYEIGIVLFYFCTGFGLLLLLREIPKYLSSIEFYQRLKTNLEAKLEL